LADLAPDIPRPSHAYVPGLSARHPEDWFDGIKHTAQAGMSVETLRQSRAFIAGVTYFEAGYFWECHEVLEAVWMALPRQAPERKVVQAVIQLANARLKLKMERPRAVLRLCDIVDAHLAEPGPNPVFGFERQALGALVSETREAAA